MRIVHIISEFSRHEAMGRSIAETVARVPGEHHLIAARIHDGEQLFAGTHEVGGGFTTFAFSRGAQIRDILTDLAPDLVHVHGGALAPLWASASSLRRQSMTMSVYGWPRIPRPASLRRATFRQLTRSNVLRPRVVLSTLLPASLVRRMLRSNGVRSVLSPDPDARVRLRGAGVRVLTLPSGAAVGSHRAAHDANAPVVLFAGRAEMVRGIDTVLDAFRIVHGQEPGARLRLLLIPTAELPLVEKAVAAAGLGDACEVVTSPVADLSAELAAAQVGVWPFKFDYTTSPPAMALAEAMAVGLPVVATDVTCVRSIARHDDNALLVPVAAPAELAAAILGLIRDRDRWQRLADAGIHTITHEASWDAAAERTSEAYGLTLEAAA
jgi:glycosyltransferase involved in cell wall biosynthesis